MGKIINSILRFALDVLSQIDDQVEGVEGIFIDASHRVIDKVRAEKEGKEENPGVMIGIFVHSSKSFRIN